MKSLKLAMSALLMGTTMGVAQAQTEAGKILLNGRINYHSSKGESNSFGSAPYPVTVFEKYKSSSFDINPQVGYFIAENLAIGIIVGAGVGKSTNTRTDLNRDSNTYSNSFYRINASSMSVGPFMRYYKMIGDKIGLYSQLSGGYQYQLRKYSNEYFGSTNQNYEYKEKTTGSNFNLTPGFVYFPSKKIVLELNAGSLTYSRNKSRNQNTLPDQIKLNGSSSGFQANLGIQYFSLGASLHL